MSLPHFDMSLSLSDVDGRAPIPFLRVQELTVQASPG